MFKGYELALVSYGLTVCREQIRRGFEDTCFDSILNVFSYDESKIVYPPWLGDDRFDRAHRSNLLRKNKEHYSQFNWSEPDDIPYFWPTKELAYSQ